MRRLRAVGSAKAGKEVRSPGGNDPRKRLRQAYGWQALAAVAHRAKEADSRG